MITCSDIRRVCAQNAPHAASYTAWDLPASPFATGRIRFRQSPACGPSPVAAVRLKAFEQARSAEIDTSIARVEARRALLETGAISKPDPHTARTHAWPVPQRDTSS